MVTEEAHAAVVAENDRLTARIVQLETDLAQAVQRITELEAKKTPRFAKANVPAGAQATEATGARAQPRATAVVDHPITHCPDCGSALGGGHVGRRCQVVDLPPPPAIVVTEHRVGWGWCAACGKWREAALDLGGAALARGRLGARLAALVAHWHLVLRLPLRSIQRYLADLHVLRVSVGELVEPLHRVAAHGAPVVAAIRDRARGRAVVHADETGWRENSRGGYVRTLAPPEGERYFEYHHSRAGAVAAALLGDEFRGVLVTDFFGGYNATPGGRHQRCWGHLLRNLHALAAAQPAWTRMHAASPSPPTAPAATHQLLLEDVRALGAQLVDPPGHPCRPLAWRFWHFQDEVLACVREPAVPADNNLAERAIRPQVIARKISGGTRLNTLADTWRASGLHPLVEFRRLLQDPLPQI